MIILQNPSNKGKTSVLSHLAYYLKNNSTNPQVIEGSLQLPDYSINKYSINNFLFTCIIKSKKIAIVSMGDNHLLKKKIDLINKDKDIDILFGACRSQGITVKIINEEAKKYNAHLILTSTYKTNTRTSREDLNKIKADELFRLLDYLKIV